MLPVVLQTPLVDSFAAWSQVRGWAEGHAPNFTRFSQGWVEWTSGWTNPAPPPRKGYSWDGGLSLFFDIVVSIIGWTLLGNSWPGVRTGCQRAFRNLALLLFCLAAHYLWALCWPVISVSTAVVFGIVGLVRVIVRKPGTLVNWAQKAPGGVPEAAGATFLGPGIGRIPETADLRTFKKVGSGDKWILVKREVRVAVFKAGADSQTIKTAGLFVPVEVDSWRGDPEILSSCQGSDKVHLCCSLMCSEDGQHFKEYAVARDFDLEKFQLKNAELQGGKTLWTWFWSSTPLSAPKPQLEFGSESEQEPEAPCDAHKVKWSESDHDVALGRGKCKCSGSGPVPCCPRITWTSPARSCFAQSTLWSTNDVVEPKAANIRAATGWAWTRAVEFAFANGIRGGLLPAKDPRLERCQFQKGTIPKNQSFLPMKTTPQFSFGILERFFTRSAMEATTLRQ